MEKKYFDHVTYEEQVTIMSETDILFGFHGAAFVNIMFMRPYSGFVEIFSPVARIGYYESMAKRIQLFYAYFIRSKVDRTYPLPNDKRNYNLILDISSFISEYEEIVKKVRSRKYSIIM